MKQRHITKNSIIIQNGGEQEIRKPNYWFADQFLVNIAFSTKQWNLNLPPTLSQNQIAITVEDFNESVQAADVEAFITQERGPHQNCPIIICWHIWHIWVRETFLVLLFRYPSTDSGY